jgi:hypothetical protein
MNLVTESLVKGNTGLSEDILKQRLIMSFNSKDKKKQLSADYTVML